MEKQSSTILLRSLAYLKGVGESRAKLLAEELELYTFADLLSFFPFRYEDRTKCHNISEITEDSLYVQLKGRLRNIQSMGEGGKKRLEATLEDQTGQVKLIWFQSIHFVRPRLKEGVDYLVFGKPNMFSRHFSIPHPDFELFVSSDKQAALTPIYHSTEKLRANFLDSKGLTKLVRNLFEVISTQIAENLTASILGKYELMPRIEALQGIHFPSTASVLHRSLRRLKFEELFFVQLKLLRLRHVRLSKHAGLPFTKLQIHNKFFHDHLAFPLTNAQKRVIREIYTDLNSGKQMNRLLQGDVGSGKTVVAFMCMLMAIDNEAQACLMAPTEVLAEQHFKGLQPMAEKLGLEMALLTGSTKRSERNKMLPRLAEGSIKLIVGTHALIEDEVQFQNLGLCIIDEQHRFGVAQRAKLWQKQPRLFPHVLVMTATPIPRTLAMTLYGDLDVSVIDEMPAGRKPIQTVHRYENNRAKIYAFLESQIQQGYQAYVIYPLIEESETLNYKSLMAGVENIQQHIPTASLSVLHGKMSSKEKEQSMAAFAANQTQIMVATTVVEVGVNVPNANVILIENADRFGLSQLHQLRGRVGRGQTQSYCILLTEYNLSQDARQRLKAMTETTDGFKLSELDLKLRGPGALDGTQQSGVVELKLANLAKDGEIVQQSRMAAIQLLEDDPTLVKSEHKQVFDFLQNEQQNPQKQWGRVS
ncbi:MAG: ATP-dependent DNA helicase RecG [Cytophagales bacterium]|nr:MAG: ATP-dependent DNA helicase RecG [Cytophagales bacterium]TAF62059.1 MAG: ATP-dependent DNA helicase RecG [Cytophagales bacterium]